MLIHTAGSIQNEHNVNRNRGLFRGRHPICLTQCRQGNTERIRREGILMKFGKSTVVILTINNRLIRHDLAVVDAVFCKILITAYKNPLTIFCNVVSVTRCNFEIILDTGSSGIRISLAGNADGSAVDFLFHGSIHSCDAAGDLIGIGFGRRFFDDRTGFGFQLVGRLGYITWNSEFFNIDKLEKYEITLGIIANRNSNRNEAIRCPICFFGAINVIYIKAFVLLIIVE